MISQHSPVNAGPSTSAAAIAAELGKYNSPLAPYAQQIYDLGVSYGVDPAFFMAVCWGENNYGTVGAARTTYNWCSVSDALYGGVPTDTRWGQYPTPQAGIEAFYRLITGEYYPDGQTTLYTIWWGIGGSSTVTGSHAYAPAFENSESSLDTVVSVMNRLGGSSSTAATPPPSVSGGVPPIISSLFPANTPPAHQWAVVGIAAAIVIAAVLD